MKSMLTSITDLLGQPERDFSWLHAASDAPDKVDV